MDKQAMFITGIGTATPPRRYLQKECWVAAQNSDRIAALSARSRAIVKKVLLGENGITGRYLALESIAEVFDMAPDTMQARFARHAPALAIQAAQRALIDASSSSTEVDAVVISTCTGYLCPGLTTYVSEGLGLRPDVLALDLVGQGCGAALPNLRTAQALIAAGQCRKVLSVCVEICSAAFYIDDDPGVLVSACLFGDAAAAAVLSAEPPSQGRRIQWLAAGSVLNPALRDALRFEQRQGLLRNVLTPQVPLLAAEHAEKVLDQVLQAQKVTRSQIRTWLWHAGGRDVLLALQKRLSLPPDALFWSASTLRELGNVSSPFILHVLHAALTHHAPGGWWWMSSFGAGFSCHGALLQVDYSTGGRSCNCS